MSHIWLSHTWMRRHCVAYTNEATSLRHESLRWYVYADASCRIYGCRVYEYRTCECSTYERYINEDVDTASRVWMRRRDCVTNHYDGMRLQMHRVAYTNVAYINIAEMNVAYVNASTLCCIYEWGDVIASWIIAMVCVWTCIVLHIWMSRTWMSHIWMQHIWILHTRFVNQTIKPLKLWTPNSTAQKTYLIIIKRLTCVLFWHVHTHDPCVHVYNSWLFEYTHVSSRTCLASAHTRFVTGHRRRKSDFK